MSARLLLSLACEQKPQFAVHFRSEYVSKYAVVGLAFMQPPTKPSTMAEPDETRINGGKAGFSANVLPYLSLA